VCGDMVTGLSVAAYFGRGGGKVAAGAEWATDEGGTTALHSGNRGGGGAEGAGAAWRGQGGEG
jgi:hypothetical protein